MKNLEKQDEKESKLNNFIDKMLGIAEKPKIKPEKSFYPLPKEIKDELIRCVDHIKHALKDNKEDENYIFKQSLGVYTDYKIIDKIRKWTDTKYGNSKSQEIAEKHSELVGGSGGLLNFLEGYNLLVLKEVQKNILSTPFCSDEEYRSALHSSIIHEFIEISNISKEDVKALGETYGEML